MGKAKTVPFIDTKIYEGLISGSIQKLKYRSALLTYSDGFFCMKGKRAHSLFHHNSYDHVHLNRLWCSFAINEG